MGDSPSHSSHLDKNARMDSPEGILLPHSTPHEHHDGLSPGEFILKTEVDRPRQSTRGTSSPISEHKHMEASGEAVNPIKAHNKPEGVEYPSKPSFTRAPKKKLFQRKSDTHWQKYRLEDSSLVGDLRKIRNTPEMLTDATRERMLDELRLCKMHQEERRREELRRGLQYRMERGALMSWHCNDRPQSHEGRPPYGKNEDARPIPRDASESDAEGDRCYFTQAHEQHSRFSDPMSFIPPTVNAYAVESTRRERERRVMEDNWWLAAEARERRARESALEREGTRVMDRTAKDEFSERISARSGPPLEWPVKETYRYQDDAVLHEQVGMPCGGGLGFQEGARQSKLTLRQNLIVDQQINCILAEERRRRTIIEQEDKQWAANMFLHTEHLALLKERQQKRARQLRQQADLKKAAERAIERKAARLASER